MAFFLILFKLKLIKIKQSDDFKKRKSHLKIPRGSFLILTNLKYQLGGFVAIKFQAKIARLN